jgi:tetratricopeptide (TPR) repeat protein
VWGDPAVPTASIESITKLENQLNKLATNPRDRNAQRGVYDVATALAAQEAAPRAVWSIRPQALEAAQAALAVERRQMETLRGEVGKLVNMSQGRDPLAILEASRGAEKLPMIVEDPGLAESVQTIYARLGEALRAGRFKDDAAAYEAQGYLAFHSKNWEGARGFWERAMKAGGNKEILGTLIERAQSAQEGEEREEKIFILLTKGKTYFNAGQYEKAAKSFDGILKLDPAHMEAKKMLSSSRIMLAEVEKDRALSENLTIGAELKKRGKFLEASNYLLKALRVDPGNEEARRHLQDMMGVLEKGSAPSPRTSPPSLAKPSAASLVDMQKSEGHYITGLRHYMGGERKKAKEEWQAALLANPQHKKAQAALNQLLEEEKFSAE